MVMPFPLPDWVPWWLPVVVLVPVLFFGVCFLLMPFSVFGTKARLESIDARLDEIQGEIRSLAMRLPEPGAIDDGLPPPRQRSRPPIPPAGRERDGVALPGEAGLRARRPAERPIGAQRPEPRLEWPPRE
jgi:hypothetical protein